MTRDDMAEWVKHRLGAPLTDIEMVVEEANGLGHIHMAIQDCLDMYWKSSVDESSYQDMANLPGRFLDFIEDWYWAVQ